MEMRDSTPPFYFKRLWDPHAATKEEVIAWKREGDQVQVVIGTPEDVGDELGEMLMDVETMPIRDDPLLIYGRKIVSPYAEDQAYIRRTEANGYIYTQSFSVMCVDGEVGSHPVSELTEISKDEFEAARGRGWTAET